MIEIKKILFPTDFSEYSRHALKYAKALAKSFKAKLYVLHVCEHPIAGAGIEAYHFSVPEYVADLEQRERKALDSSVVEIKEPGLEVEPIFILGRAYQEIVKTAKGAHALRLTVGRVFPLPNGVFCGSPCSPR
jgi:nucleotide-binding universal stress UspA family protein